MIVSHLSTAQNEEGFIVFHPVTECNFQKMHVAQKALPSSQCTIPIDRTRKSRKEQTLACNRNSKALSNAGVVKNTLHYL